MAREADDKLERLAGQVPGRCRSPLERRVRPHRASSDRQAHGGNLYVLQLPADTHRGPASVEALLQPVSSRLALANAFDRNAWQLATLACCSSCCNLHDHQDCNDCHNQPTHERSNRRASAFGVKYWEQEEYGLSEGGVRIPSGVDQSGNEARYAEQPRRNRPPVVRPEILHRAA